jgi:hypothetical protein
MSELTIFFARLLGLYMSIVGLLMLFMPKHMKTAYHEMLSSAPLIYLAGAGNLLLGLAIAISHPIWVGKWFLVITLLGYCLIARGVWRLMFAHQIKAKGETTTGERSSSSYWLTCVVFILLGFFLVYNGYAPVEYQA